MKLTLEAAELLRNLALLRRTESDVDSPANPAGTRKTRVLELRKRLVQALRMRS